MNIGKHRVSSRLTQPGKTDNQAKVGKQRKNHRQKGIADIFHRLRYPLPIQQRLDFPESLFGAFIVIPARRITIHIIRHRIGISRRNHPVNRPIAMYPYVPVVHIDHKHRAAVRAKPIHIIIPGKTFRGKIIVFDRYKRRTSICCNSLHLPGQFQAFFFCQQFRPILDQHPVSRILVRIKYVFRETFLSVAFALSGK